MTRINSRIIIYHDIRGRAAKFDPNLGNKDELTELE